VGFSSGILLTSMARGSTGQPCSVAIMASIMRRTEMWIKRGAFPGLRRDARMSASLRAEEASRRRFATARLRAADDFTPSAVNTLASRSERLAWQTPSESHIMTGRVWRRKQASPGDIAYENCH
jgi:hypothetical protein